MNSLEQLAAFGMALEKATLPDGIRVWQMPAIVVPHAHGFGTLGSEGQTIFPVYGPNGGLASKSVCYLEAKDKQARFPIEFERATSIEEFEKLIHEAAKQFVGILSHLEHK